MEIKTIPQEELIHYAKEGGGSLCTQQGDVRWLGITTPKKQVCPSCWRMKKSLWKGKRN